MFKKYVAYLRDNPQGYWFKRKVYGWGWVPVKWQGWAVIFAYVGALVVLSPQTELGTSFQNAFYSFPFLVILLTAWLLVICYYKGESPRWQWGLGPDREKKLSVKE